jgi:hypothetical protein
MVSKRWIVPVVVGLSLAGVPMSAYAQAQAQTQDKITPEARAYFKNGVELLQSEPPNYQDAYYQFKLAYEKSQSWKVLGNLGLCAVKLERDGEALAHYDEYLKRGGKQINKEEREAIERDMLLIKGNGATLELTSKVLELKLQDSRSGSSVAPQSHDLTGGKKSIFVRAGSHRLTATASDGRSLVWEVSVEPGTTLTHDFDFDAPVNAPVAAVAPVVAQPPPPPPQDAPPQRTSPLATIGYITGGVGVAVLGAGVVTGLMANSKEKSAKDKCDANKVCDPSAEQLFDDAAGLAKTTNILLISGGVLTAAGVGMVILGVTSKPKEQQTGRRFTLVPVLSANAGGVFASGTF